MSQTQHGEDDQSCPFPTTGARSVKPLKHGRLKSYPGLPHGMPTTHADQIRLIYWPLFDPKIGTRATGQPRGGFASLAFQHAVCCRANQYTF